MDKTLDQVGQLKVVADFKQSAQKLLRVIENSKNLKLLRSVKKQEVKFEKNLMKSVTGILPTEENPVSAYEFSSCIEHGMNALEEVLGENYQRLGQEIDEEKYLLLLLTGLKNFITADRLDPLIEIIRKAFKIVNANADTMQNDSCLMEGLL